MNIQGINPAMTAPVQTPTAQSTTSTGSSSTSGSSSSSSGSSSSSLQSTFLNLLVTELQNQDPTQPVDPTQMVGQMISLNQLDQLISINQALTSMTGSTTSTSSSQTGTGTAQSIASPVVPANLVTSRSASVPVSNFLSPLAAGYSGATGNSGLMNLYGSYGVPAASTNLNSTGVK